MALLSTPSSLASALIRMPFFSAKTYSYLNLRSSILIFSSRLIARGGRRLEAAFRQRCRVRVLVDKFLTIRIAALGQRPIGTRLFDRLLFGRKLIAARQRLFLVRTDFRRHAFGRFQ